MCRVIPRSRRAITADASIDLISVKYEVIIYRIPNQLALSITVVVRRRAIDLHCWTFVVYLWANSATITFLYRAELANLL